MPRETNNCAKKEMDSLRLEKSILATLVYYDVLGNFPLTLTELYKYLTNYDGEKKLKIDELADILSSSQQLKSIISQKSGFFYLKGDENKVERRLKYQKIAYKKWRKTRRIIKIFQFVPFVEQVFVSGSLALDNTKQNSDIDVLVVAKYGRIWTVWASLAVLTQILGCRRHQNKIADKICLNHFITDESMEYSIKNLSNAHLCAHLTPVLGKNREIESKNHWVLDYLPNFAPIRENSRFIGQNSFFKGISKFFEKVLRGKTGDLLEKILARLQIRRTLSKVDSSLISFNPKDLNNQLRTHLCLSDEALLFHFPVSRNIKVQNMYDKKIKNLLKRLEC